MALGWGKGGVQVKSRDILGTESDNHLIQKTGERE